MKGSEHLDQPWAFWEEAPLPSREQREAFLERCVLSVSGLRFIHSGDEEDPSLWAGPEAQLFVACAVEALEHLAPSGRLWLGRDARPTGPLLIRLALGLLEQSGREVQVMDCGPIPEVMAATHQNGDAGFVYFTASHNPKGHNGLKLGLGDGAVLSREPATRVIEEARASFLDDARCARWRDHLSQASAWPSGEAKSKAKALDSYRDFALKTLAPSQPESLCPDIKRAWGPEAPLVLVDMNGSSRLTSVDIELIEACGLEVEIMGGDVGVFHHAIVPEGASLEPLNERMQQLLDEGRPVLLGMVPDCDGDRGNLILPVGGRATALAAQETFALCALAEMSTQRGLGEEGPLALVVNGPSSLRLEKILEPFAVSIHRAEVGEANVLALAKQRREAGDLVPLAGEGSNGGSILHPSTVRDPLMTLLSLLRFIALPLEGTRSAAEVTLGEDVPALVRLQAVLTGFPSWFTTDAFEGDALMPVPTIPHETLKANYESLLEKHFREEEAFWSSMGVTDLAFFSNEGTENLRGPGHRPSPGKGGLQVFLQSSSGQRLGYLWMRGSGTEPVFRVVVDWSGSRDHYEELLSLHRRLISASCS